MRVILVTNRGDWFDRYVGEVFIGKFSAGLEGSIFLNFRKL